MLNLTDSQKKDFMKKAAFIADNASCNYKVGCVGVIKDSNIQLSDEAKSDEFVKQKNGFIYVKSWNQTLKGEIYCQAFDENGKRLCVREVENLKGRDFQKVCSSHAEIGLIAKCAKYGIPTRGMVMFITNSPCIICSRAIVQAGFSAVYFMAKHTSTEGFKILKANNILIEQLSDIFDD